jgi:hypothetical protein
MPCIVRSTRVGCACVGFFIAVTITITITITITRLGR